MPKSSGCLVRKMSLTEIVDPVVDPGTVISVLITIFTTSGGVQPSVERNLQSTGNHSSHRSLAATPHFLDLPRSGTFETSKTNLGTRCSSVLVSEYRYRAPSESAARTESRAGPTRNATNVVPAINICRSIRMEVIRYSRDWAATPELQTKCASHLSVKGSL